ncbi:MAG: nuclease [Gemmatimonadetes bacterium]|nr:nuclease [Gemmatimonadota bacterium]MYH53731.1 nuclease [Gemmatimonadota bacterium]MYK66903.1 nuclease [Gemmatimonadota bacterium]
MADSLLREKVRAQAEDRPGVYRWLGPGGRILYVGKSVRLKTRLLSYFREETGKTARLVAEAEDVTWDWKPNEFAALIREMRLIRAWQPEYNVQHKRDRRYGFIRITREPAPRLVPVSRVHNDGASYYGPFAQTGWLARAVHDLSLATGLRDCPAHTPIHFGDQLEIFSGGRVPRCIRADTGTCLAPCAGRCTTAEYDRRLRLVRSFLEARSRAPLAELADSVKQAADDLRFEYAATIRDRMETLEKLWSHLSGFRGQVENLNLVYPVSGYEGDDRIYLIRRGRPCTDLPWPKSDRARRRANEVVEEVFQPVPADRDGRLEADAAAEVLLTVSWFNRHPRERERAMGPERWLGGG